MYSLVGHLEHFLSLRYASHGSTSSHIQNAQSVSYHNNLSQICKSQTSCSPIFRLFQPSSMSVTFPPFYSLKCANLSTTKPSHSLSETLNIYNPKDALLPIQFTSSASPPIRPLTAQHPLHTTSRSRNIALLEPKATDLEGEMHYRVALCWRTSSPFFGHSRAIFNDFVR